MTGVRVSNQGPVRHLDEPLGDLLPPKPDHRCPQNPAAGRFLTSIGYQARPQSLERLPRLTFLGFGRQSSLLQDSRLHLSRLQNCKVMRIDEPRPGSLRQSQEQDSQALLSH